MANATVADTIAKQLCGGYGPLMAMVGATHLAHDSNSLQFRFKGYKFANHCKIELTPADDYTITFTKIRGINFKTTDKLEGLYFDQIQQAFENLTGLYLTL